MRNGRRTIGHACSVRHSFGAAVAGAYRGYRLLPEDSLPAEVDVLIVGAGYTGLSAARETAAAGRATLVLDAGAVGAGCSGRNGGQVAYSIKPSFKTLSSRYGEKRAYGICQEGRAAVAYLRSLATRNDVDCDWRECGCFYGAHTPHHFELMAQETQHQIQGLEQRITVVPKSQQRQEIASDFYQGGCVYHDDSSVDPMKLLLALLRRAQDSGAAVRVSLRGDVHPNLARRVRCAHLARNPQGA